VTIDKPYYAQVQLHVSGYIRSDIVLEPGGVEFGQVDRGNAAEKSIQLSYAGRSDWKVVEARTDSPYLEADVVETSRSSGRVSYQLNVRLTGDAPVGYLREQVTLVTNDRRAAEIPVDVEGRVAAEVTVSPQSLSLGALKPGQKVTKTIVIQARKPFEIVDVSTDGEGFEFKIPTAKKSVQLVQMTFIAGDAPGKFNHKLRIETDLGEDITPELSAFGQVIEQREDQGGDQAE